jgi:hypothetical protein
MRVLADKHLASIVGRKILLWNRYRDDHFPGRNTSNALLTQLSKLARQCSLIPIVVSSEPIEIPDGSHDLTNLWEQPGVESYREQLAFFDLLQREHAVVASIGDKSGAMDGPALLGLPTTYLEARSTPTTARKRMEQWLHPVVPRYEREFLNAEGLLEDEESVRSRFEKLATAPATDAPR